MAEASSSLECAVGHVRREKEREMEGDRYFECTACGAVVQGWHAAIWYRRWHEDDCDHKGPIVEIERDDEEEED